MTETLLPLTQVRSFRLTLADIDCLAALARAHGISQSEALRFAIRHCALGTCENGIMPAEKNRLRRVCAGLALGPAVAPTVEAVEPTLVEVISALPRDDASPPGAWCDDVAGGPVR